MTTLRRIFDTLDEVKKYLNKSIFLDQLSVLSVQDGTDQVTLEQFKAMASLMERRSSEDDS